MDTFAQIALDGIGGKAELLYQPTPIDKKKKCVNLNNAGSDTAVVPKMNSKDELLEELRKQREYYSPFLEDNAPKLEIYRRKIEIDEFMLEGKKVKIPYYQGPLGNHKQVYTTTFELYEYTDKACYLCIGGADYYAVIYVNDVCVGTHEGFFSPFEFEITDEVRLGTNRLRIDLYNDYIFMGNGLVNESKYEGDKLYAATGLGWDDPKEGWHHCPAGMGIHGKVCVEMRNRVNITDLYVRPMTNSAELWIEVENADYEEKDISFEISVFGQNFKETVIENMAYIPKTIKTVGRGDSLTEAAVSDILGKEIPLQLKHGKSIYKVRVDINEPKIWDIKTPYLYQAQVKVLEKEKICDTAKQQFGMRSFRQDTDSSPKGMFYLNGRKIRLRGANTMGFEQQDVLKGDYNQLIDDLLYAKICNMNFLRLTQRPVQDEVYEYCDKLGLMTQSDLPLFGCMRRTKICEGVRQAEEMERIVRKHACNILISYINEPFPNANNEPHRHLEREELEKFFDMCDIAVKIQNPDRVIKHIDGDYDPPSESMPDNHCYPMWYNGHGIDVGMLNKGYWLSVKPDWYYGCGEYGAEGLDFCDVMNEYYPKEWIAEPFNPRNIIRAQTADFHYFFYDTQDTMEDWIKASHNFQAYATRLMTEAFRRDDRMVSNAIHLFIDAWPAGWMKAIMDCKRNPKPAYFAYKDALEPIIVSLRTDRFTYFSGEKISIEAFICNDTNFSGKCEIVFEYFVGGKFKGKNSMTARIEECCAKYAANAEFAVNDIRDRETVILRAILLNEKGEQITYNDIKIEVFEDVQAEENDRVEIISKLPVGTHKIAGETVTVKPCGMLPVHFVSRKTGHKSVEEFYENDFSYWYNKKEDMITPILDTTFTANGFTPILTSGNLDKDGKWNKELACAEKIYNGKKYIICQVDLRTENPVAKRFLSNLYKDLGE
jgi:hypothetical protein